MGSRGPAPKPTALKVLEGVRKDRINTSEPKPTPRRVACPSWLSPEAKRTWRKLAPELIQANVLTWWDCDLFARYCECEALSRMAIEAIHEHGPLIEGAKGGLVRNPAIQIARDAVMQMRGLAARFGLTPADRSQLRIGENSPDAKGAARLLS